MHPRVVTLSHEKRSVALVACWVACITGCSRAMSTKVSPSVLIPFPVEGELCPITPSRDEGGHEPWGIRHLQSRPCPTSNRTLLLSNHKNACFDPENNRGAVSDGSPLPPYMATAPRQHIRQHTYAINETHSADLYEWCTSVVGEPTRYGTTYEC